ncbi:hypothetical protein pEaSNUABM9_00095 [Erwinia phage pEa_SNUABM_9]|nr:hypothetical protein pEaSNUABM9_00095 [Erwinia phage pEa_SNUABM_9]
MSKFIPVESIRDFTLSKSIMQNIQVMIEIENSTRGHDLRQYVDVSKDGYVVRCAMVLIETGCATVLYTHDMPLPVSEALVREFHPEIDYVQCFTKGEEPALPAGWGLVSANFKSRISIPFKEYRIEDTENPIIKKCLLGESFDNIVCTIVGNHMTVAMKDEPVERVTQLSIDLMSGVAVDKSLDMSVRCLTKAWAEAFDQNPSYEFTNALIGKRLR